MNRPEAKLLNRPVYIFVVPKADAVVPAAFVVTPTVFALLSFLNSNLRPDCQKEIPDADTFF